MNNNEWFQWVLGGFMALLVWLGKNVHRKASAAVSRTELREYVKEWQDERRSMHAENKETLARIHERVDELYRDMNVRRYP